MSKPWTREQNDFIRNHPMYSIMGLVRKLGHTYQSTKAQRRKILGSVSNPTMVKATDELHMQRWREQEAT